MARFIERKAKPLTIINLKQNSDRRLNQQQTKEVLPGFAPINRYWDAAQDRVAAKILPGEYYVTMTDEVVVTVLGSCVSACVRDKVFGIGGMNHFMLPEADSRGFDQANSISAATRYGSYAMEHLINDILKFGGHRKNLEVKITGGGRIISGMTDIGRRNIQFVRDYLKVDGLDIVGEHVGDNYPRKVYYYPQTGVVRVKKLRELDNRTLMDREQAYLSTLKTEGISGDVELFD